MLTVNPSLLRFAIAGTHGKSMSGLLLKHILDKSKSLGTGEFIESLPFRKSLPRLLSRKEAAGWGWLGIEISPEGLYHGLYKDISFNVTILTNLFPPQGGTLLRQKYLAAHRKFLAAIGKKGICLLNADDPLSLEFADAAGERVITYALHYPKAMVTAENYKPFPLGSAFDVVINGDLPRLGSRHNDIRSFPVRLPLPGEVGVYTALAAVTAALALGVGEESIIQGLKTFPGLKRRLEFIHINDIHIIDDIAPSAKAVKALFESLTALRFQKIIIILGIEKGAKEALAEIASELLTQEKKLPVAEICLTTCAEYQPATKSRSRWEERAFLTVWREGKGQAPVAIFHSLIPALQEVALSLSNGDLLLLMGGKGMNAAGMLLSKYFGDNYPGQDPPAVPEEVFQQWSILNPT